MNSAAITTNAWAALERGADLLLSPKQFSSTRAGGLGAPADIGAAMAFFASDDEMITGQILVVDGGQTLPEG